jgi:hypothetical protein
MFVDTEGSIGEEDLHELARNQELIIRKAKGREFCEAFKKDPVNMFKSLPLPDKRVMIRIYASKTMGDPSPS